MQEADPLFCARNDRYHELVEIGGYDKDSRNVRMGNVIALTFSLYFFRPSPLHSGFTFTATTGQLIVLAGMH